MSDSISKAAKSIVESMKHMYSTPHTIVPIDEKDFGHLALSEYKFFRDTMEAEGFKYLADLEILEVSNSPTSVIARTMIRSLISNDGAIATNYYQVMPNIFRRLKLLLRGIINLRWIAAPKNFMHAMKTRHCIDFETEFSDDTFLITTNAETAGLISGPPTIENHFFPYGTPYTVLLKAHRARLQVILHNNQGLSPKAHQSLPDILQMQKRQNAQKMAHRATMQWVTQSELQGLSPGNTELANTVFDEVQKLLNEDEMRA